MTPIKKNSASSFSDLNRYGIDNNDIELLNLAKKTVVYTGSNPLIALTNSFSQDQSGKNPSKYIYTRINNPNFDLLEKQIGLLYNSPWCITFSSGMAAISSVFYSLSDSGTIFLCSNDLYPEVPNCLKELKRISGLRIVFFDPSEDKIIALIKKFRKKRIILYSDSCGYVSRKIVISKKICKEIKKNNSASLVVVDNTTLTPALFNPFISQGADIVIDSAGKYLDSYGGSQVGIVTLSSMQRENYQKLLNWRRINGAIASPLSCWMASKGIETLRLRMEHTSKTALGVANFISNLPFIDNVAYPLEFPIDESGNNPKLLKKGGGIILFLLKANKQKTASFIENLSRYFSKSASYGGALSSLEYASRKNDKNGCWLRLSVGLQSKEEINLIFLTSLFNTFSKPIGKIANHYRKISVIEIELYKKNLVLNKNSVLAFRDDRIGRLFFLDIRNIRKKNGSTITSQIDQVVIPRKNTEIIAII